MTDITMPRLSDSMEEGTVLRWLKAIGETVSEGEELVEIETDKATMTFESPEAGILADPVPEGATYPVGAVIATMNTGAPPPTSAGSTGDEEQAAPAPSSNGADVEELAATGRSAATPMARRVAVTHNIDLTTVTGTGPRGRVTRSDVAAAAGLPIAAPPSSARAASPSRPPADESIGSSAAAAPLRTTEQARRPKR